MMPRRQHRSAFTLLELLVATAVFAAMTLMLVSISGHAANLWSSNQGRIQMRSKARTVLEFMAREMSQAVIPLDPTETKGPWFVLNPQGFPPELMRKNALFWTMPLASKDNASGDLAGVGYFVREVDGDYRLCRFYVEPGQSAYALYTQSDWASSLVDAVAPASEAQNYQGLLLEGTLGIWITAYDASGQSFSSWDSRAQSALPATVKISVAFMDRSAFARVESIVDRDEMESAVQAAGDAQEFIESLPEALQTSVMSTEINFSFSQR